MAMPHLENKALSLNIDTPFVSRETPSLANCIEKIRLDDALPAARRRDLVSGLQRAAAALDRAPDGIPADPVWLQPRLNAVMPASKGITAKTWSNILSNAKAAMAHCGIVEMRTRRLSDLSPIWRALWKSLLASRDATLAHGLGRFVRFLDANDISPDSVDIEHVNTYLAALRLNAIRKDPEESALQALYAWNRAVRRVPGWPPQRLEAPRSSCRYGLPLSSFPESFQTEFGTLLHRLAKPDPLDPRAFWKALRPDTITSRGGIIVRFASALVHTGVDISQIVSLRDLVEPKNLERGLRWLLGRSDNNPTQGLSNIAFTLRMVARYHVLMSEAELSEVNRLCGRLIHKRARGLTVKNRERLMPFDDATTLERFLGLFDRLWVSAMACPQPYKRALQAETAIAIGLLTYCPIRRKNLVKLDCGRDLIRLGRDRVVLQFQPSLVKNSRSLSFELPEVLIERIDAHLVNRVGTLCPPGTPWLFPKRDGSSPMLGQQLGERITKAVRTTLGLDVNPHLFRHFSAKLLLKEHPGHYELVRRVLGHAETSTVWETYVGLEADDATRLFSELVERSGAAARKGGRR